MEIFSVDVSLVLMFVIVVAVTFVLNFSFNKKIKKEKNSQITNISNNKNISGQIKVSQNISNGSDREER
jgi:nitrogen fixation protein FixH